MKNLVNLLAVAAAFAATFVASVSAGTAEVGSAAPDFSLVDINGQAHKLSDYKGKTVVLEWVNPECPIVKKHYNSSNMQSLQKEATSEGVVWIAINSGHPGAEGDYDAAKASQWLKEKGAVVTAYCRDSDGKVGHLYGAKTTPHMYVITPEGKLVYNGAIDSIRGAKVEDIPKATNYVKAALSSLKEGKPIAKATSEPYGCSVKY